MKLRALLGTAALVPALLLSVAAAPPGVEDESTCRDLGADTDAAVCTIRTYLQCRGDAPIEHQQLDGAARFDYAPPGGSFSGGNGCGRADEPIFGSTTMDSLYELNIDGFVEGNIDTMTVDLFLLGPGIGQLGQDLTLDVRVVVDGASAFGNEGIESVTGDQSTLARRVPITVTPVMTNQGATVKVTFTVTGLQDFLETAAEPGVGETERFIQMTVNFPHQGTCQALPPNDSERCVPGGAYLWAWGADEIPAGVTFNATEDADLGTVVPAGEADAA